MRRDRPLLLRYTVYLDGRLSAGTHKMESPIERVKPLILTPWFSFLDRRYNALTSRDDLEPSRPRCHFRDVLYRRPHTL